MAGDRRGRSSWPIAAISSANGGRARCRQTSVARPSSISRRSASIRRESLRVPRRKTRRDGRDPVPGRDPHDVLEGRLAVEHGPDARGGRQQLRRERVGLHLPRVRAAAAERLVRVDGDPGVVAAADVADLVREREAHAHRRVRAVDPEHRAVAVAPAAPGDLVGERRDGNREARAAPRRASAATRAGSSAARPSSVRSSRARLAPMFVSFPATARDRSATATARDPAPRPPRPRRVPSSTATRRSRRGARATRRPGRCRRRRRTRRRRRAAS